MGVVKSPRSSCSGRRKRLADTPIADAATLVELQTSIGGVSDRAIGESRQALQVLKEAASIAASRLPEHAAREWRRRNCSCGWSAYKADELRLAERSVDAAERAMRRLGDMAGVASALAGKAERALEPKQGRCRPRDDEGSPRSRRSPRLAQW